MWRVRIEENWSRGPRTRTDCLTDFGEELKLVLFVDLDKDREDEEISNVISTKRDIPPKKIQDRLYGIFLVCAKLNYNSSMRRFIYCV